MKFLGGRGRLLKVTAKVFFVGEGAHLRGDTGGCWAEVLVGIMLGWDRIAGENYLHALLE